MAEPVCVEKFFSPRILTGMNACVECYYTVMGTDDRAEALALLRDGSALEFDLYNDGNSIIQRSSLQLEPLGPALWDGVAQYAYNNQFEPFYSFDTAGGTQHITHALTHVATYAAPGRTAPDPKGGIGVTRDGVEGVDIVVPVYNFGETHYFDALTITPAYKATLAAMTGRVNGAPWKGWNKGEVLFLGSQGAIKGYGPWEVNYKFAALPNVTDLTIGDIQHIDKEGWQYLWIYYDDQEDTNAKMMIKRPLAVYVEQVYRYGDFIAIGIGNV